MSVIAGGRGAIGAIGGARAVFLDRDGTLNRERGFVARPDQLEVLPGVPEALAQLARAGFALVVLTNQSGVARGLYTEADLARVHAALHARLQGLPLAYLHCPHHPEPGSVGPYRRQCACRKPAPGLLRQAQELLGLELAGSFLVGDSARDLLPAKDTAVGTVLLRCGKPWQEQLELLREAAAPPHHVAADLPDAARWILQGV